MFSTCPFKRVPATEVISFTFAECDGPLQAHLVVGFAQAGD